MVNSKSLGPPPTGLDAKQGGGDIAVMESLISTGLIGLSLGTQYALISIGFTLIFGILGVINFAHGGFYILGGYLAFTLSHALGLPYVVAVLLAMGATGVLGYVIEFLLVDKYVNDHLATMIITLGLYLIMTTGIIHVYGPEPAEFRFPVSGALRAGGIYMPYANLIVLVVCMLAIAGVYYLIFKTRYGIALRAMADDRPVATAQGIVPARMFPMAFGVATALAGLTGALVTPILALDPHGGEAVVTKAFIIVILGGLGSVGGATVAAFIVGIIEAYSSVYLGGSKGALALFALVLLILLVRPSGLMGREARRA
jgi:branched-chain amino acid transport system permease protein